MKYMQFTGKETLTIVVIEKMAVCKTAKTEL